MDIYNKGSENERYATKWCKPCLKAQSLHTADILAVGELKGFQAPDSVGLCYDHYRRNKSFVDDNSSTVKRVDSLSVDYS